MAVKKSPALVRAETRLKKLTEQLTAAKKRVKELKLKEKKKKATKKATKKPATRKTLKKAPAKKKVKKSTKAAPKRVAAKKTVKKKAITKKRKKIVKKVAKKKPAAKKKSKSSKSQKPAKADDVNGGIPILATCGLMLLGLVGLNFYVFTSFSESATAFFYVLLVVMNILGLIAVSVPYFCWTVRGTINIYEVCLGLAVIALVIGSAALIIELARYGGDIDPSASIPVEQSNDIYLV